MNFDVFNNLDFPVCIISEKGMLLFKNHIFSTLIGDSQDENGLALDLEHPFYPEYRKRIANAYREALGGFDTKCFAVLKTSDDQKLPVEIYLYPLNFNDEKSILAFFKEVDQKNLSYGGAGITVESSERIENDNIFEYSPNPLIRVNSSKEIIAASVSIQQLTGFLREELLDHPEKFFDLFSPFDREKINSSISEIIGKYQNFKRLNDIKIINKDEQEKSLNILIYPLKKNKKIIAAEIYIEDITKITRLEQKISHLNKSRILNDMFEGLIHSFNNVINIISNKTQIIMQLTDKQNVLSGLKIINETANEGARKIRRIQDFISSSDRNIEEVEEIVNIVEDAIEFAEIHFKVENMQKRRSVKISKQYYMKRNINCNVKLLKEIFVSMIFKMASYIKDNGIIEIDLKENSNIIFSVNVQKEFTKEESPETEAFYLPDIELRKLAEKMEIRIYEEESSESINIRALIPLKYMVNGKKTLEMEKSIVIRDMNILIIEDEKALSEILFELFDTMGNRVSICEDGETAVEKLKNKKYDIVISDYGLGGMTGFEILTKVREMNEKTLTVLLSGWMLNDIKAYKSIIDLYLPKPFQIEKLLQQMSSIYERKNS